MTRPRDADVRLVRVETDPGHTSWPCREDPDLWFSFVPEEVERAKGLCRHCPAIDYCLAAAVAHGERWGVWGGQLIEDGRVIPRKRGPGRPRKETAA